MWPHLFAKVTSSIIFFENNLPSNNNYYNNIPPLIHNQTPSSSAGLALLDSIHICLEHTHKSRSTLQVCECPSGNRARGLQWPIIIPMPILCPASRPILVLSSSSPFLPNQTLSMEGTSTSTTKFTQVLRLSSSYYQDAAKDVLQFSRDDEIQKVPRIGGTKQTSHNIRESKILRDTIKFHFSDFHRTSIEFTQC